MEDKEFETALWGLNWDKVLSEEDVEQGAVSFTENEGVRLAIPFGEILQGDMFGDRAEAEYLYGFSRNGDYLVLGNARSAGSSESYPGGKRQNIHADFVMSSRNRFDPSEKIESFTLKLKGLKEWLGEAPITATHYNEEKRLDIEMNLAAAPSIVLSEINPKISIEHSVVSSPLTTSGISLKHDCFLNVALETPCSIDEVQQDVIYPIQKFFSFCIGKHASVIELKFRQLDSEQVVEYRTRFASDKSAITDSDNMPRPYYKVKENLQDLFSTWMTFDGDLERGSSLLVSLLTLGWKMPIDLEFLAGAQMLETLARHNQSTEELSQEEFTNYLNTIEDSIGDEGIKHWAMKKLEHSNYVTHRKLLKNLLNEIDAFSRFLIQNQNRFLENHLRLRNAYTHRSDECESPTLLKEADLYWHMQSVLYLSYGVVLIHLGYTPEETVDVFRESNYEWYKLDKVRKFYS